VPNSLEIVRTGAIPASVTRLAGIGDLGLRAYWHLKSAIAKVLVEGRIDLLFVTMSPYYNALAGPELKKQFNVPLVLDFQDPWISRWGATLPKFSKGGISHFLGTLLESRVVRYADHITSVSDGANDETRARYPTLPAGIFSAMPIGGDAEDYSSLENFSTTKQAAGKSDGEIVISYAGTVWPRCYPALRAVLTALKQIKHSHPELYQRIRFNFVGTSAQSSECREYRVVPHASEIGVSERVTEIPRRVGYMRALRMMLDANIVLIMGSDEPHYTASKLQPVLLSRKPVLAIFHESSSACDVLRRAGGSELVTFNEREEPSAIARRTLIAMLKIIQHPDSLAPFDEEALTSTSAKSVSRQFANLFDRVVEDGCRRPWW
jgi:hypothetical protein